MSTPPRSATRVEGLYQKLRQSIMIGQLPPGARLNLNTISQDHSVSLTVTREAVVRLAADGLLQSQPRTGYAVRALTVEEVRHLADARIALEGLVLGQALEHGDLHWETSVVAAHHLMVNTDPKDHEGWSRAHADFHAVLGAACPNPVLRGFRSQLFDASEIYRWWSVTIGAGRRRGGAAAHEHSMMLEAVLARDADKIVEIATGHIQGVADSLIEAIEPDTS